MVTRMLYGVDPFRNIRRLQDEVSRGAARALEFPAVNVFVNQDGVIITAELPGVRSEDLDILTPQRFRYAQRRAAHRN